MDLLLRLGRLLRACYSYFFCSPGCWLQGIGFPFVLVDASLCLGGLAVE